MPHLVNGGISWRSAEPGPDRGTPIANSRSPRTHGHGSALLHLPLPDASHLVRNSRFRLLFTFHLARTLADHSRCAMSATNERSSRRSHGSHGSHGSRTRSKGSRTSDLDSLQRRSHRSRVSDVSSSSGHGCVRNLCVRRGKCSMNVRIALSRRQI